MSDESRNSGTEDLPGERPSGAEDEPNTGEGALGGGPEGGFALPITDDELDDELAVWDEMFDALHEEAPAGAGGESGQPEGAVAAPEPPPAGGQGVTPPHVAAPAGAIHTGDPLGDLFADDRADLEGEPESLGEMLGASEGGAAEPGAPVPAHDPFAAEPPDAVAVEPGEPAPGAAGDILTSAPRPEPSAGHPSGGAGRAPLSASPEDLFGDDIAPQIETGSDFDATLEELASHAGVEEPLPADSAGPSAAGGEGGRGPEPSGEAWLAGGPGAPAGHALAETDAYDDIEIGGASEPAIPAPGGGPTHRRLSTNIVRRARPVPQEARGGPVLELEAEPSEADAIPAAEQAISDAETPPTGTPIPQEGSGAGAAARQKPSTPGLDSAAGAAPGARTGRTSLDDLLRDADAAFQPQGAEHVGSAAGGDATPSAQHTEPSGEGQVADVMLRESPAPHVDGGLPSRGDPLGGGLAPDDVLPGFSPGAGDGAAPEGFSPGADDDAAPGGLVPSAADDAADDAFEDIATTQLPTVAAEWPAPRLPRTLPPLRPEELSLPDQVEPAGGDRAEDMARELMLYEGELDRAEDPAAEARLNLEAGRLSEALGDLDRARDLYERALEAEPDLAAARQGLRRVARTTGDWDTALTHLDAELAGAGELEREGLLAHRLDLLEAAGEPSELSDAASAQLEEDPGRVRARLAELDLALAEGRSADFAAHLDALADALATGDPVVPALLCARGAAAEAVGDAEVARSRYGDPRLAGASAAAGLDRFRTALATGDQAGAADALADAAKGPVADSDPALTAALARERAEIARATGDDAGRLEALWVSAASFPESAIVLEELALACERAGEVGTGVQALGQLATMASAAKERAHLYRRAARLESEPAARLGWLWSAVETDPGDPGLVSELFAELAEAGDADGAAALDELAASSGNVFMAERAIRRRLGALDPSAAADLAASARTVAEHPALVSIHLEALEGAGRAGELAGLSAAAASDGGLAEPAEVLYRRAAKVAESAGESTHARSAWSAAAGDGSASALAGACRSAWAAQELGALGLGLDDARAAARHPARVADLALRRAATALMQGELAAADAEAILAEATGPSPDNPRLEVARLALLGPEERWLAIGSLLEERASAVAGPQAHALRYRAGVYFLEGDDADAARAALEPVVAELPSFTGAGELLDSARRLAGDDSLTASGGRGSAGPDFASHDDLTRLVREAEALEASGDVTGAASRYKEALRARPGHPVAREALSRIAADAGEAAALAEIALEELRAAEDNDAREAKAEAYEELARIDGELRGDHASALLGFEAAAEASPSRIWAVRELERAYGASEQLEQLAALYGKLREALGDDTRDALLLSLERARIAGRLGRPRAELLSEYQHVYRHDPGERIALFALEADRRERGASEELAELDAAVAGYFRGDARAQAAFLIRAGETLDALGQPEAAISRFREAALALPGNTAALAGWQRAALAAGLWRSAAEAAEAEAEHAASDTERARLHHLAGVLFMDREGDEEAATASLRRALSAKPTHGDAFSRLWRLFEGAGAHVDLSNLLFTRLEVERDRETQIALNRALAELHAETIGDQDEAAERYRAILELEPQDTTALAGLADIAISRESWQEAEGALVARARVETDPRVLTEVFWRLGTIYADHMEYTEWALKSFQKVISLDPSRTDALERLADLAEARGDYPLALSAWERLIKSGGESRDKVADLHRIGRICLEGFQDRERAERAFRAALEQDPSSEKALSVLVNFHRQGGEPRALRIQLDRVARAMRARVEHDVRDAGAYQMLAKVLAARADVGVDGSSASAARAAEIATLLGSADGEVAELAKAKPPVNLRELGGVELDDLLFPSPVPPALRQLVRLLSARMAKYMAADPRSHGVGRGDRRKRGDPAADVVLGVAHELGAGDVDIYVTAKHPHALVPLPTNPPAVILGADIADSSRPEVLRFAAGRAIKIATSGLAVLTAQTPEAAGVMIGALVRHFQDEFSPVGISAERLAEEQHRLRKLVPGSLVQEVAPYAVGVAGQRLDPREAIAGIEAAGNRAGLLACGSIRAALSALAALGGRPRDASPGADPATAGLMRFAVSEDFTQVAAALAGGARGTR